MAKEKKVEQITDMEVDFAQWYTDIGLADVKNHCVVSCEYVGQAGCQPRLVISGNVDLDYFNVICGHLWCHLLFMQR